MSESELASAIERLMVHVDYYLHCELDDEYDHDRPDSARQRLERAIRDELIAARSSSMLAAVAGAGTAIARGAA